MKQLSNLTKIMFCLIAVLLVITVMLGIATAVKDSKDKQENAQSGTTVTPIPTPSALPEATETPEPEREPEQAEQPEATSTPVPTEKPAASGSRRIALDPGQQKNAMTEDEPVGPGASAMVDKMSYGATSTTTGKREYEWTLPFTLKLKEELTARGYEVFLTREEAEVTISNAERARMANESGADIYLSIQADAAASTEAHGIYAQIPSQGNVYSGDMYEECRSLAKEIQNALIKETGAKDRGVQENDKVAALNYSEIPVAVFQLGFMSNVEEDTKLWSEDYQNKMVKAICDGIDAYFGNQE
ncbi:MAG: N-acetylmuramoyl-L-alanine amidase [Lachnospiraceae bacterium]|nr:N-acetylmuramoyl-L-alanine amidase [Lachnospiraceae bacterium]